MFLNLKIFFQLNLQVFYFVPLIHQSISTIGWVVMNTKKSRKYTIVFQFENVSLKIQENAPSKETLYLIKVACSKEEYMQAGLCSPDQKLEDLTEDECMIRFVLCGKVKIPLRKNVLTLNLTELEYTFIYKGIFYSITLQRYFDLKHILSYSISIVMFPMNKLRNLNISSNCIQLLE